MHLVCPAASRQCPSHARRRPAMSAVAKHLALGLDLHLEMPVVALSQADGTMAWTGTISECRATPAAAWALMRRFACGF